jgi:hypothetical protein
LKKIEEELRLMNEKGVNEDDSKKNSKNDKKKKE